MVELLMPWTFIGFFKVPVQHRHRAILSVLLQLDLSMAQRDSNSQPKDDPCVVSLDNNEFYCAIESKLLVSF